jgi:adenylate cyclase
VIGEVPENDFLRQRQVEAIERAARMTRPAWLEPTWMPALNEPILSFIAPVRRNGRFAGTVVVSTRLDELARFLKTIETEKGVRAFILYDSRYVLGHPELLDQGADLSGGGGAVALPTVETFHEDAFRLLQEEAQRAESLLRRSRIDDAPVDEEFIVLIREIRRYGAVPWQIALRFRPAEVTVELDRLRDAAIVGFGILLLAVATGYFVTRNLNRQIGRLAATANRLRELDVADLEPLPDSRLRELAHAARAFNALIAAMRWFETYVPKALVHRLMQAGDRAMHSDERTLTILFTDIRGFSTQVEHMSPVETADFLNRHFALLADCVEAEDGTVDKFIGDSIMAFWGGTGRPARPCCARAACRACDARRARRRERAPARRRRGHHGDPHRHPQRPGRRRQYRLAQPAQLHGDRRHCECRRAPRSLRQGTDARRRLHRRHQQGHPAGRRRRTAGRR